MSNKKQTRYFITFVIFGMIFFFIVFKLYWDDRGKMIEEYVPVTSQTSLSGRVIKRMVNRGIWFIVDDGNKYRNESAFRSKDGDEYDWELKAGDSIYKRANNDTLVIVRDGISTVYIKRPGDW